MLKQLRIRNIALIEELDMELYDGFSVLTGETGAGKSIIIEALNFVLGERASRELIMSDKPKASVEAVFAVDAHDPVLPVLKSYEMEAEDGELILYREMTAAGKNVCRVGGAPVTAGVLKTIGDALVDIHGQHAHQQLLNQRLHIALLDTFAGEPALLLRTRVSAAYAAMKTAERKLNAAVMDARDRERRCDLLSYQLREIDNAQLVNGEEDELLEQRKILQNAQAIMESLDGSAEGLAGESGAVPLLSGVLRLLDGITQFSAEYSAAAEQLRDAYYSLEDVSTTVRGLRNSFSYDPESLDKMEWRLETISSLKRKYGDTVADVLAYRVKIAEEYELLITSEERHEQLQHDFEAKKAEYAALATELSALRKAAAEKLSAKLVPELGDLGMPSAQFDVSIQPLAGEGTSSSGSDDVEFLLSTNFGEPVKPLSKVASGGEISRIMLAFKSVFAGLGGVMTMVFDEIDTGISGRVGTAVAEKMRQIARARQVLCITHLPQIAAYAHQQYLVHKSAVGKRTLSTASLLSKADRINEIARIMGGLETDAAAIEHARRLLLAAEQA